MADQIECVDCDAGEADDDLAMRGLWEHVNRNHRLGDVQHVDRLQGAGVSARCGEDGCERSSGIREEGTGIGFGIMPSLVLLDPMRRKNGRTEWIRTTDLHTPSVAHYQTVLRPDLESCFCFLQGVRC